MDSATRFDSLAVSTTVASAIGAAHLRVCRSPRSRATVASPARSSRFTRCVSDPRSSIGKSQVEVNKGEVEISYESKTLGVKFQLPQRVNFQLPLTLVFNK
jgi:hypothetical protein